MKRSLVTVVVVVIVAIIAFLAGRYTCINCSQQPCLLGTDKAQMEKKVMVTFSGADKHEVSLAEAKQYIQTYRKSLLSHKTQTDQIKGGAFERGAIEKILAQPGCAQLRIYFGQNEDGKRNLVLVGVDTTGKDMTKACIMERIAPCPPWCDETSELK
jgi:hypothetical protein